MAEREGEKENGAAPAPATAPPAADYLFGLDLGQTSDPTALTVVRRTPVLDGAGLPARNHRGRRLFDYLVAHLHRFPLGTPYPRVVEAVGDLLGGERVRANGTPPVLGVDATGVGRPVVDMFIDADLPCDLHPVTITGGESEGRRDSWNRAGDYSSGPWSFWVPKLELAGAVQAALSGGRLKVVPKLELAATLRKELLDFRVKFTAAANVSLGAFREGQHDDIVLAVAIAVWLGDTLEGNRLGHLRGAVTVAPPSARSRFDGTGRPPPDWDRRDAGDDGMPPRRKFYGR